MLALDLDKMTVDEKLNAIDQIWMSMGSNHEDFPTPAWHEDVLKERQAKMDSGEAKFIRLEDLDTAMKRLRNR